MSKETDYDARYPNNVCVCVSPTPITVSPIVVPVIFYKGDNKYNS